MTATAQNPTRPQALPVNPSSIPDSLKVLSRWVLWRYEWRDGKWTKPPFQVSGAYAKSTASSTWCAYSVALATYEAGGWDGIGLVLIGDGLTGIDLDHCRNPESGMIESWAHEIINRFPTYAEISPSGTGIRLFCLGNLPPGGRRKETIELYDNARYLTVTGHHLPNTPPQISPLQEALTLYHQQLFPLVAAKPQTRSLSLDDDTIIRQALIAKNSPKFGALWKGDLAGYQSQSEADLALCSILSFWAGQDADIVDRLFRRSGLYREEKWGAAHYSGGQTYGQHTVATAVVNSGSFAPRGNEDRLDILEEVGLLTDKGKPTMSYQEGRAHLKQFKEQIAFGEVSFKDIQKLWTKVCREDALPQANGLTGMEALNEMGVIPAELGITGLGDFGGTIFLLVPDKEPVLLGERGDLLSWKALGTVLAHEFGCVTRYLPAKDWLPSVWPHLIGAITEKKPGPSRQEETWSMLDGFLENHAAMPATSALNISDMESLRKLDDETPQGQSPFHVPVLCNGQVVISAQELMSYVRSIEWAPLDSASHWKQRMIEVGVQWRRLEWRNNGRHRRASVALIPQEREAC